MSPIDSRHNKRPQGSKWSKELHRIKLLYHAIAYTNKGWAVIPLAWVTEPGICSCSAGPECHSPGKHPLTNRGVHDATTAKATIIEWWQRWPLANIGIATGFISGFVVLDIDGETGHDSLHKKLFSKHGRSPDTVVSVTASGRHILFRYPDQIIRNDTAIVPGIDVRGDNGYIVAPPSMHSCGLRYEWHPLGHPRNRKLADPKWFLSVIDATKGPIKKARRYGEKDEYNIDRIKPILEGQRNAGLFKVCARFCGDGWTRDKACAELHRVNTIKCVSGDGESLPLPESEVDAIVGNVYKRYVANKD